MGRQHGKPKELLRCEKYPDTTVEVLDFDSRAKRDNLIRQLNHRMSIRSIFVPKVIYYQPYEEPNSHLCSNGIRYSLAIHFETFGQAFACPSQKRKKCKCVELINTILELRERYGNFNVSSSQIFVKYIGDYETYRVWISSIAHHCVPEKAASEKQMCQSIADTFEMVFKQANCMRWGDVRNIQSYQLFRKQILEKHSVKRNQANPKPQQINVKNEGQFFTFHHIVSPSNKVASPVVFQVRSAPQEKIVNAPPKQKQQLPCKKKAVPKLSFKEVKSEESITPSILEQQLIKEEPEFAEEDAGRKEESPEPTTGRSPRVNYLMRRSSGLTIFPNQYQQKFIRNYRMNCQLQQNIHFETFKRAMQTLKQRNSRNVIQDGQNVEP